MAVEDSIGRASISPAGGVAHSERTFAPCTGAFQPGGITLARPSPWLPSPLANLYKVVASHIPASLVPGESIPPSPSAQSTFAGITDRAVSAPSRRQDPCLANLVPAVRSAKWVAGLSTRHMARAESQLEAREDSVDASVFTFIYKGETTVLNVPEGSIDEVIDLAAKEDYEGLKELSKGWQCKA